MIMEKIQELATSTTGIFLYALLSSLVGIFILLAFLSMFMVPMGLVYMLPLVIAFNSAAGGYALLVKAEDEERKTLQRIILALLLGFAGAALLPIFCPWEALLAPQRYLIAAGVALIGVWFGSWLGRKAGSLPT